MHDDLPRLAVDGQVREHQVGNRVVVPIIARGLLVIPHQLAGCAAHRKDAVGIEIIAGAAMYFRPWAGLTRAYIYDVGIRIISHTIPDGSAPTDFPPLAAPGFRGCGQIRVLERFRRIARHGIEAPCHLTGFGIVSGEEAANPILAAANANNYLPASDHAWRHRDRV